VGRWDFSHKEKSHLSPWLLSPYILGAPLPSVPSIAVLVISGHMEVAPKEATPLKAHGQLSSLSSGEV
jgi:hypothetical protein